MIPPPFSDSSKKKKVSLDSLNPQQLTQVKKQLDDEVEHLTNSFAQLHAAQGKFKECLRCVNTPPTSQGAPGPQPQSDPNLLIPSWLTVEGGYSRQEQEEGHPSAADELPLCAREADQP